MRTFSWCVLTPFLVGTAAIADSITLIPPLPVPVGSVINTVSYFNSGSFQFVNNVMTLTNDLSVPFISVQENDLLSPQTFQLKDVPGNSTQYAIGDAVRSDFSDVFLLKGTLSSHLFAQGGVTYLSTDPTWSAGIVDGVSGSTQLTVSSVPTDLKIQATNQLLEQILTTVRTDPANQGKSEHDIADLAFGAVVSFRNSGFTGAHNEFTFLQQADINMLSAADHFLQAYDVGTGNTLNDNPLTAAILGTIIDPVYNIGKAVTTSNFFKVDGGTQSPANFDFWAASGAAAAIAVQVGGTPPGGAPVQQPIAIDGDTSTFMEEGLGPFTLDPTMADGFDYSIISGAGFQSIDVPSQACVTNSQTFQLDYDNIKVILAPDQTYTFSTAVNSFSLDDLGTCSGNVSFQSLVSFAGEPTDIHVFTQTAVSTTSPTPEPSTLALIAVAVTTLLIARKTNRYLIES